jgi:hypothetical protein
MRITLSRIRYAPPPSAAAAWGADGEPIPAALVELPAVAIPCLFTGPQPDPGKTHSNPAEGEGDTRAFKFYTRGDVDDGDEATGRPADVIVWAGARYKVVSVAPYTGPLGARKVRMIRE